MPLSSRSLPFTARHRARPTVVALAAGALALGGPAASAHEVPARVGVRMLARVDTTGAPAGTGVLRIVVRAPLAAMRDVDFPVRPDSTLDLARLAPFLREAAGLWVAPALGLRADGVPLPTPAIVAVRAALPNDRALDRWDGALAALREGRPSGDSAGTPSVPWTHADLDVLLEVPLPDAAARVSIEPALAHLGVRTTTVLRFVTETGAERAFTWEGDPGRVELDPRWHVAARRFVRLGVEHIATGFDHLLFLLCLVLPVRRLRPLVAIVTSFTVAHSLTLVASALGHAPTAGWFPPLVEVVIAASIVWMALENIVGARLERRWAMAFGFGLVHGFGFSFALGETLQFAGAHLALSLAAFNAGVEIGQVALVALAVPLLDLLFRRVVAERPGVVILSAFVAHEAWHWTTARAAELRAHPFAWPAFDATLLAQGLRALAAVLVVLAVGWALGGVVRRVAGDGGARPGDRGRAMGRLESGASRGIGAWVLLAALLPAAAGAQGTAASAAARTSTMAGVYTSEQADQGKEVFAGNCLGCHTTASHTGPAFLGRWMGRPLAELFDYLSSGMPKSAPGSLTEDEYVWVTAYILKLNGMPAGKTPLTGDLEALATVRVDTAAGVGAERPRRFGARLGRLRTAGDADAAPSLDQSRPALHSRAVPSPARAPGTRAPAASPP